MASYQIGDINERGYLMGLRRRGYTLPKCLLELWANAIDAHTQSAATNKKIVAWSTRSTIRLLDNAKGMTADNLKAMFSMHHQNHSLDTSMGVSGIGAKPALCFLSEEGLVKIKTRVLNGEYLIATVPWNEIMREHRYTGKVTWRLMNEEERIAFYEERVTNNMLVGDQAIGTTIEFQYNDALEDLLVQNTLPVDISSLSDPLDRISVVFGHVTGIAFEFRGSDGTLKEIRKYNYFGGHRADYYCGVKRDVIQQYYCPAQKVNRFLLVRDEERLEIHRIGKGFAKVPARMTTNLSGYRLVGTFDVVTGCRVDEYIFNPSAPKALGCNGYTHPYEAAHVGSEQPFAYKTGTALIRNQQAIGVIPYPDVKSSNARSSSEAWFEYVLVKQELSYNPISTQENEQDVAMQIQENKNQHNGAAIPVNLTRLLRYIKVGVAEEILKSFAAAAAPPSLSTPEAALETTPAPPSLSTPEAPLETTPDATPPPVPTPSSLPTSVASSRTTSPILQASVSAPPSPLSLSPPPSPIPSPPPLPPAAPNSIKGEILINMLNYVGNNLSADQQYDQPWATALFNALNDCF